MSAVTVFPPLQRQQLFRSMQRLRVLEETIASRYAEQKMRCPVHLSTGQEAVSAGIGMALEPTDLAVSGHRAHAHYIAKGGSMRRLVAELYGKVHGCSRGKGGSMHLIDESVGFKGSTAIVGGTIPVGTGLGLSIKRKNSKQIACVFFGEAAVEEGAFYESANFAALHRLPVLYLCENNLYSVYSPLSVRQPAGRRVHEMVAAIGLQTDSGDGNDPEDVYLRCRTAVDAIRAGAGPIFLEFATYRWREHCGPNFDNDIGYRTEAEYLGWKARDPIRIYEQRLLDSGALTPAEATAIHQDAAAEVAASFEFAEESAFPAPEDAATDVHAKRGRP